MSLTTTYWFLAGGVALLTLGGEAVVRGGVMLIRHGQFRQAGGFEHRAVGGQAIAALVVVGLVVAAPHPGLAGHGGGHPAAGLAGPKRRSPR